MDRSLANALDRLLGRLEQHGSLAVLALALLPVMLLLLLPVDWNENEYNYFMLALRRVAPGLFSEHSAAFDPSNARIVGELLLGGIIHALGYETAHAVLRVTMAVVYAMALAHLLSGFGITVLEALLVLAGFIVLGPDLIGDEWLFQGVSAKTFAYALVFFGLGFICRGRPNTATACFVAATYLHFLVGGLWFLGGLLLLHLRQEPLRRLGRWLALFALAVGPLIGVILLDWTTAAVTESAQGLTADYIYSILRNPHHVAPFAPAQLERWADGIVVTAALAIAFWFMAKRVDPRRRPLLQWLTLLAMYLIGAVALSYFDRETGFFGKFYLFRPGALILLLAIMAAALLCRDVRIPGAQGLGNAVQRGAFLLLLPLALWQITEAKLLHRALVQSYSDLDEVVAFVQDRTEPGDIVLIKPIDEMRYPDVALPMLLGRPTLVSYKFVPTDRAGIHRWYERLQFRQTLFQGGCPGGNGELPIRLIVVTRPDKQAAPGCGEVVWRSDNFLIEGLPPGGSKSAEEPERGPVR